ncbi:10477_t:CDS:1, partial [Acaulospora morrowiae]
MFLSNKQIPIYFGEKNYSPSLPSPPPSPHEAAIKWPLRIGDLKQQSRYRMRISDAPSDLLDYIEKSKYNNSAPSPTESLSFDLSRFSLNNTSSKSSSNYRNNHMIRSPILNNKEIADPAEMGFGRHKNVRKNPYPVRAPSTNSQGLVFKVDMFTPVLRDPIAVLRENNNDEVKLSSPVNTSSTPSPSESHFSCESRSSTDDEATSRRLLHKKQPRAKQTMITKRTGASSTAQRKRKGNSLARVMTDRGLLESIFNSNITSNDI